MCFFIYIHNFGHNYKVLELFKNKLIKQILSINAIDVNSMNLTKKYQIYEIIQNRSEEKKNGKLISIMSKLDK